MKKRILSMLLSLTLLVSMAVPVTAETVNERSGNEGMEISKTAKINDDGTYTITLEAYATGEKIITDITKDVPTDVILVLDQSGSMADNIGSVTFSEYEDEWWLETVYKTRNQDYYGYRHNGGSGNLWYKLDGEENIYVSVSVTKQEEMSYTEITNGRNASSDMGWATNYWDNRNNLYAKVNGEYQKVTVTREGDGRRTYVYKLGDNVIARSQGRNGIPDFSDSGIEGGVLYLASKDASKTQYTYTYTDSNGSVQTIGISTGDDTIFKPTLYERTVNPNGGASRLATLKEAAGKLVDDIAAKARGTDGQYGTADDINHRIAVVGFASQSGYGNNTELLSISGTNSSTVGVAYNEIKPEDLKNVVQSMNSADGVRMAKAAIDALAAQGATQVDLGMDMAERILKANPVPEGEQRNRIVIVFTDGAPTSSSGFDMSEAKKAINEARDIKELGATVYAIGVFSGADANSEGTEPSGDLSEGNSQIPAACNWFMQNLSSNNGTVQMPSYYLSASDAFAVNDIFQQITQQIESNRPSTSLTEEAVIRDVISPYFTLPEGTTLADIELTTYHCTGQDSSGFTWSQNESAMGATAALSEDGTQVSVTGFDFSKNYIGSVTKEGQTTYFGDKLRISFKVTPKKGFLGGNNVYTNTSAKIYEKASSETPLLTYERPTVNVPIPALDVTAEDMNVYLKGEVTAAQLREEAIIKVGQYVELDLTKPDENYGLESWQTEYVNIKVEIKDEAGNVISDKLEDLKDDTTYTIKVTVEPKTEGTTTVEKGPTATTMTGKDEANIYVFKPELTYKDSNAYYGESIPENNDYSGNLVSEVWKHGTAVSTDPDIDMIGENPTLEISYTPDASKLDSGKYTKQDVPVVTTVKIGTENVNGYTAFVHQDCDPDCEWTTPAEKGTPAFLVHIKTCTLSITKQGGEDNESYVFDIYKDGEKYSEVTVWGNDTETISELPVGKYTIQENAGWSWRYTTNNGKAVDLNAQNPKDSITCTNTKTQDGWLNGFSEVIRNIIGGNQ